MNIACCIWALRLPELDLLRQVRELGFSWIDIQPKHLQTVESQLLAQELGLGVSCLGASFGLPKDASLDHTDAEKRRAAARHVNDAIVNAARVGASIVYIVPGGDPHRDAMERFAESLMQLAAVAEAYDIKLAIEHFPGTALPTASETLEFIYRVGHTNLHLLVDTGHLQMSGEEPESVIENAGDRLAYVHVDDNDGIGDLHWSLLDGVMTEESLITTLRTLESIGYQGAISLELSPNLDQPDRALRASRDVLLRAMHRAKWL